MISGSSLFPTPAERVLIKSLRIVERSWDNETVLGSSRKLGGAA